MIVIEILQEIFTITKLSMYSVLGNCEPDNIKGIHGPVIFMDGYYGGFAKRGIGEYFRKKNIDVYFFKRDKQPNGIDVYTEKLRLFVKKNKIIKPTIIGFSMGGLVAVDYANKYGWNNVDKIITIETPFYGAWSAKLPFVDKTLKDMDKNSQFLKNLRSSKLPKHRVINVYGKWDQFMRYESCILPNTAKYKVNIGGHNNILSTKYLDQILENSLK